MCVCVCFSSNTNLRPFLQSDPIVSLKNVYQGHVRLENSHHFEHVHKFPFPTKTVFFHQPLQLWLLLLFVFLLPPSAAFADGPASSAGPLDFDFFEIFLTFFLSISELRLWSDWVFPSWKDFF